MASEEVESRNSLENFYEATKAQMKCLDNVCNLRYIFSRSTKDSSHIIESVCNSFERQCRECEIPIKGVFLKKTESSVKVFKYLICNTNFVCQKLLSNDTASGRLVNFHPPFTPYLLVEIIWHLHFDDLLAESMLHFPLDLCVEIAEVLTRCLDLLDFQRAVKFLTTFIQNVYKKLISLKDVGSQTQDPNNSSAVEKLVGNLQELILQFTNKRSFKLADGPVQDRYKRCGILLKKIIQMVKICFSCKCKKFEVPAEMQNLYKLTFGDLPLQTVDPSRVDQYLTEINQGLIRLLLKKVKEIDCNVYLNWTEYDDEDNTSLCLQRAIGLECYFFIESTKEFIDCDNKDFIHLTECLQQLASKPDPNNSVESFHLTDLCQGVLEGRKDCLIALFKRYKEWDNTILDSIDSNILLIDKEICEQLFDHLAMEFCNSQEPTDLEKLQLYTFSLARAFISLKITDLYEIAVKFILQFGENTKLENDIDISNFENFIMHNPNLSNAKNLRVVMFFLCLKTLPTLKILLKMAIGHSDYPDVAISISDLMILIPILKIKSESMVEALRTKCEEKSEGTKYSTKYVTSASTFDQNVSKGEPRNITLAVRVLRDICLEGPKWNYNKFADLLQAMYGFCKETEVINEIFTPFLTMELCPWNYLKSILVEIHKVADKCCDAKLDFFYSLQKQGLGFMNSNNTSRYIVDELLTSIIQLINDSFRRTRHKYFSQIIGYQYIFLCSQINIDHYLFLCQRKINVESKYIHLYDGGILRHVFLNCTKKQFMECIELALSGWQSHVFKWTRKIDACVSVIRLTLENCLLCLEYPEVAPPDSISFMLRRLIHVLPLITVPKKKNFTSEVCRSLDTHLAILKSSIEYTAVSEAYNELIRKCEESKEKLPEKLIALEQFASSCSQESEKLKVFTGPHSPIGIRLWLVHDTITAAFDESVTADQFLAKLDECFK